MNTPSSFAAAGNAWERTRKLLFKPFDIGRWFTIGFSAWLAMIGSGGNFPDISKFFDKKEKFSTEEFLAIFQTPWVIGLIVGFTTIALILGILFCWLRSRGDFMFVHHLYQPNSAIKDCWQRSKQHAQSLFQWRIVFFLITCGLFLAQAYLVWEQLIQPYMQADNTWSSALNKPLFIHIIVFVIWAIAVNVMIVFLKDFVVPIMYWRNCSASTGWTTVLALCNEHPFSVIGYLLAMILFGFIGGLVIILIVICTCCTALIPLILPYISAVAVLPYYLFFRAYPIYFLSQWRPDLVPAPAEEAVAVVVDIAVPQGPTFNV